MNYAYGNKNGFLKYTFEYRVPYLGLPTWNIDVRYYFAGLPTLDFWISGLNPLRLWTSAFGRWLPNLWTLSLIFGRRQCNFSIQFCNLNDSFQSYVITSGFIVVFQSTFKVICQMFSKIYGLVKCCLSASDYSNLPWSDVNKHHPLRSVDVDISPLPALNGCHP